VFEALCIQEEYSMQWIIDNKEWVFSGVGVFVLSLVITFFIKKGKSTKQTQKSGKNSTNYQSAGDINIGTNNDKG
jgi:hypothetical protein